MKMYQRIAHTVAALRNCRVSGNEEWKGRHLRTLVRLGQALPSGAGIDCGTCVDDGESLPEQLVLKLSYHHMDEHGSYDGWSNYKIVVTPSLLSGFDVSIMGRDRNQIKDYLADVYITALNEEEPVEE